MGTEKAPAFQFYPQDYLSSSRVAFMTLEEEGAYIRLLCYCWTMGSIPKDPELCARLAGKGCSVQAATNVQRAFNECSTNPQRLVHDRLEIEREKQRLRRESASNAGKKSGALRAAKSNTETTSNDRSTNVQRKGNTSSSSSKKMKECVSVKQGDPEFDQFWNIYPHKTAKKRALKAWQTALKETDAQTIIRAAEEFARASKGKELQYIKHPATWLNDGSWEDVPVKPRDPYGKEARKEIEASYARGETTHEQLQEWYRAAMFAPEVE